MALADISGWLGVKYANLERQAAAREMEAYGSMALALSRAGYEPAHAMSQAAQALAQARLLGAQATAIPARTAAEVGLLGGQTKEAEATAGLRGAMIPQTEAQTRQLQQQTEWAASPAGQAAAAALFGRLNPNLVPTLREGVPTITGTGVTSTGAAPVASQPQPPKTAPPGSVAPAYPTPPATGYASGVKRVAGKGSSTKDTVDAKLAPNEAVLNAAAADYLGRGTIDMLNHLGQMKMGMVGGDAQPGATPGFKKGKSRVTAKSRSVSGDASDEPGADDSDAQTPMADEQMPHYAAGTDRVTYDPDMEPDWRLLTGGEKVIHPPGYQPGLGSAGRAKAAQLVRDRFLRNTPVIPLGREGAAPLDLGTPGPVAAPPARIAPFVEPGPGVIEPGGGYTYNRPSGPVHAQAYTAPGGAARMLSVSGVPGANPRAAATTPEAFYNNWARDYPGLNMTGLNPDDINRAGSLVNMLAARGATIDQMRTAGLFNQPGEPARAPLAAPVALAPTPLQTAAAASVPASIPGSAISPGIGRPMVNPQLAPAPQQPVPVPVPATPNYQQWGIGVPQPRPAPMGRSVEQFAQEIGVAKPPPLPMMTEPTPQAKYAKGTSRVVMPAGTPAGMFGGHLPAKAPGYAKGTSRVSAQDGKVTPEMLLALLRHIRSMGGAGPPAMQAPMAAPAGPIPAAQQKSFAKGTSRIPAKGAVVGKQPSVDPAMLMALLRGGPQAPGMV